MCHAKLHIENVSLAMPQWAKWAVQWTRPAAMRSTSVRHNKNNSNIRQQQQNNNNRLITTTMQMDSCTQNAQPNKKLISSLPTLLSSALQAHQREKRIPFFFSSIVRAGPVLPPSLHAPDCHSNCEPVSSLDILWHFHIKNVLEKTTNMQIYS